MQPEPFAICSGTGHSNLTESIGWEAIDRGMLSKQSDFFKSSLNIAHINEEGGTLLVWPEPDSLQWLLLDYDSLKPCCTPRDPRQTLRVVFLPREATPRIHRLCDPTFRMSRLVPIVCPGQTAGASRIHRRDEALCRQPHEARSDPRSWRDSVAGRPGPPCAAEQPRIGGVARPRFSGSGG